MAVDRAALEAILWRCAADMEYMATDEVVERYVDEVIALFVSRSADPRSAVDAYGQGRDDEAAGLPLRYQILE